MENGAPENTHPDVKPESNSKFQVAPTPSRVVLQKALLHQLLSLGGPAGTTRGWRRRSSIGTRRRTRCGWRGSSSRRRSRWSTSPWTSWRPCGRSTRSSKCGRARQLLACGSVAKIILSISRNIPQGDSLLFCFLGVQFFCFLAGRAEGVAAVPFPKPPLPRRQRPVLGNPPAAHKLLKRATAVNFKGAPLVAAARASVYFFFHFNDFRSMCGPNCIKVV